jgi:uncharacterized protein (DUF2141 family)
MMKSMLLLIVMMGSWRSVEAQDARLGTIKVVVEGIKEPKGKLYVALEKNAQDFDSGALHEAKYRGQNMEVTGSQAAMDFKDVPYGTYAIKTFHDINGDGKLNSNFIGVPTEDYGFSNNVRGSLGPAKYQEASFVFDSAEKILTITIK